MSQCEAELSPRVLSYSSLPFFGFFRRHQRANGASDAGVKQFKAKAATSFSAKGHNLRRQLCPGPAELGKARLRWGRDAITGRKKLDRRDVFPSAKTALFRTGQVSPCSVRCTPSSLFALKGVNFSTPRL